jgi:hypothetical protein
VESSAGASGEVGDVNQGADADAVEPAELLQVENQGGAAVVEQLFDAVTQRIGGGAEDQIAAQKEQRDRAHLADFDGQWRNLSAAA